MIHHFELLQKGSNNLIPYVSKNYPYRNLESAKNFKKTFCHECKPHFMGVWDTVASLGCFNGCKFHDSKLNSDVKNAFQAVSIDEKRKKIPISRRDAP